MNAKQQELLEDFGAHPVRRIARQVVKEEALPAIVREMGRRLLAEWTTKAERRNAGLSVKEQDYNITALQGGIERIVSDICAIQKLGYNIEF